MCVPLILQNKLSLAESFVTGHSHLEKHLVTLLDSWCHPSFSLEEICRYESRPHVHERLCVAVRTCLTCRRLVCRTFDTNFHSLQMKWLKNAHLEAKCPQRPANARSSSATPTAPPTGAGCLFKLNEHFQDFFRYGASMMQSYLQSHTLPLVSPQALLSPLCFQTLHGSNPTQDAHQACLPSHGEIQHWPRCVCVCVWAPARLIRWVWPHVFDAGLCPNALHKRRLDSLRFLMYSRFVEVRVANVHLSLKWQLITVITDSSSYWLAVNFSFSHTCKCKLSSTPVLVSCTACMLLYLTHWWVQIYTDLYPSSKGKIEMYLPVTLSRNLGKVCFLFRPQ